MSTKKTITTSNVASYNGKFPVNGKQGLIIIVPQSGSGSKTYTVTVSCEKGTTFKVNNTAGTHPYDVAITPVANFTTNDTLNYTSSGGQAWGYLLYST